MLQVPESEIRRRVIRLPFLVRTTWSPFTLQSASVKARQTTSPDGAVISSSMLAMPVSLWKWAVRRTFSADPA